MSGARIQEGELPAAKLLEDVSTPELRDIANAILIHAYGLMGSVERAKKAYLRMIGDLSIRQLKEELHRRFVAQSGQHYDDAWLYKQETVCLLAASQPR